jgi:REP element-mobilizing transposase RayT
MDGFWLLTWTTYGTWLPGDRRGFVSNVRDGEGAEIRHNIPGTPYDADVPGLERAARAAMKGPPIYLDGDQAGVLLGQFRETATYRGWELRAAAIMANHVHLVVGVPGDPDPAVLLHDFKSYGSRALNRRWTKPPNGTWWTESGSRRKLPDEAALLAAIEYVRRQWRPLRVWIPSDPASGGCQAPDEGVSTPGSGR